ncbi:MAG: VgrG-related protein [Thermomicrobiales bacterium]
MPETPQWHIQLEGQDLSTELMDCLTMVSVESSMNIPALATLHLHNLPLGDSSLKWVDSTDFDPGAVIDIVVKYDAHTVKMFHGEVVEVEPHFGSDGYNMVVRAFDMLHRLSRGRKVAAFKDMTNKDIIGKVVQSHGLQFAFANGKGASHVFEHVIQNSQTDLDFVRDRAAMMGCHCYVSGKTVHCGMPTEAEAVAHLDQGAFLSFRPRLTTVDQVKEVTVRGWKPEDKSDIVGAFSTTTTADGAKINGKTGAAFAAAAPGGAQDHLVTDWLVTDQQQAQDIAEAIALSVNGRSVQAEGIAHGDPAIVAGVWVKVSDVGTRYGGTYFVTNALHTIDARGGYTTEFTISGHDPTTLLHLLANASNEAAKTGLQIGVVTETDPKKALSKVRLPHLGENVVTGWARVAAVGAGKTRGIQFLPEVGDEVVVGFERGDINFPFVLGGLWNGTDAPPSQVDLDATHIAARVIQSLKGHVITFDDKEAGGGITIKDSKGDSIIINAAENSITIESKKDIIVKAQGDIKVNATGDFKVTAMNVDLQGQTGVTVKGPQVKINGDAEIEIKAGIVKIN